MFAVGEEAGQYCVEAFFFRTYQNWGNRAYFPRADRALGPEEVLDAFLAQFYLERPAPRLVLLSHAAPSAGDALRSPERPRRSSHRASACRGAARRRTSSTPRMRNAREALSRKLAEAASQEKLLAALGAAFGVERPIRRVEIYDNSHIMGTNAIGAMVVAGPEGFVKNQYRTFNIRSADLTPGDDYAMMREVLTRRFARLMRQGETAEEGAFPDTPDLVVIDGGRGQFEAAREVMAALGVDGRGARLDRQGARPQRGPRDVLRRGPRAVQPAARAIRRSSSSSGCATRRIASPSAPTGRGARRSSSRTRSTRSPASARRASARSCTPSAPPRPSPAPASPTWKRRRGSTRRRRSWCTIFSTRRGGVDCVLRFWGLFLKAER